MATYNETLIAPDGREVAVKTPGEYNDLRYGMGYRPKPEPAPAKAEKAERRSLKDVDTK